MTYSYINRYLCRRGRKKWLMWELYFLSIGNFIILIQAKDFFSLTLKLLLTLILSRGALAELRLQQWGQVEILNQLGFLFNWRLTWLSLQGTSGYSSRSTWQKARVLAAPTVRKPVPGISSFSPAPPMAQNSTGQRGIQTLELFIFWFSGYVQALHTQMKIKVD